MVVRGRVHNGVVVPDVPDLLPEGAEVRVEVMTEPSSAPEAGRRQGGWWKGRVTMADDFDELPGDLAEAFGVRTP